VDPALRSDRVRPARAVLVGEGLHVVAGLTEGGGRRAASQAGAHHDHRALAAVGGIDQFGLEPPGGPTLVDRPGRRLIVGDRGAVDEELRFDGLGGTHYTTPSRTAKGGMRKPATSAAATTMAMMFRFCRTRGVRFQPRLANAAHSPWRRWKPRASSAIV